MTKLPEAIIIEPDSRHSSSIIWLHGLGADGHDFEPIIPELHLPDAWGLRFIFPNAPVRPVTINGGMAMRAWYDVRNIDLRKEEDAAAIEDSANLINHLIAAEISAGIPSEKILLAGFSQGGAIALYAGLRYPRRLAGLLALSTYLPLSEQLASEASEANKSVPVMMCHGQFDPVIPEIAGKQSRDFLQQMGYSIQWHSYPMQHAVCLEEIQDISHWLQEVLK